MASIILKDDLGPNEMLVLNDPWTAQADSTYLRLDASNDPLTGTLSTQTVLPSSHGTYDLGSADLRYRAIEAQELHVVRTISGSPTYTLGATDSYILAADGSASSMTVSASFGGAPNLGVGFASSDATDVATVTCNGNGAFLVGNAVCFSGADGTNSATVESVGTTSFAIGAAQAGFFNSNADATLRASFGPSVAFGLATQTGAGDAAALLESSGYGSIASGVVTTFDGGFNSRLVSSNYGTIAAGNVEGGELSATGLGAVATGYIWAHNATSKITASGDGAFAGGTVYDTNASITAAGNGSTARGACFSTGNITASNGGSTALGQTSGSGSITASGLGAGAFGYVSSSTSIVASASNSFQFGPGTNATANSIQGGATVRIDYAAGAAALNFISGGNVVTDTSTGTKFGTGTTQKLGFWNSAPVAQYSTTGTTTGFTAGSGTAAKDDSTYTGNTGTKAYTVGDIVRALKTCGIMAAS